MKEKYVIRLRKIYGQKLSQQICLKRFNMMLLIIKYYFQIPTQRSSYKEGKYSFQNGQDHESLLNLLKHQTRT